MRNKGIASCIFAAISLFLSGGGIADNGELLRNGGFEHEIGTEWSPYNSKDSVCTEERASGIAHSGKFSFMIENRERAYSQILQGKSGEIKVSEGALLELSGWIKTELENYASSAALRLVFFDKKNNKLKDVFSTSIREHTEWIYVNRFTVVPEKAFYCKAYAVQDMGTGKAYFDDLSLKVIRENIGVKKFKFPSVALSTNLSNTDERISALPLMLGDGLVKLDKNATEKNLENCKGLIVLWDGEHIPDNLAKLARDFVGKGNAVFMDIKSFADMFELPITLKDVRNKTVQVEMQTPATSGFRLKDSFPLTGKDGHMNVIANIPQGKNGIETLISIDKDQTIFARAKEGNGYIYAFDILSVPEPTYKNGRSFYKYLPIANLFVNPVKYGEWFPRRMSYTELIDEMKRMSNKYPDLVFKDEGEAGGDFRIYSLNIGNPKAQMCFFYAAAHGEEWEPGYGLLSFARRLAEGEFKDKIDLDKISFKIIPVLNPFGYVNMCRKNVHKVDLCRQGDTNWKIFNADLNKDGRYDQNDMMWKGDGGPFSEPETVTYKKIIDNSESLWFVLDLHGNMETINNFVCIHPPTAKHDNGKKAEIWSELMNNRIRGRYVLQQSGDAKSVPYIFKRSIIDDFRPTLINSSAKDKYGFSLEFTACRNDTMATVMVSDLVCESILSILDVYNGDIIRRKTFTP